MSPPVGLAAWPFEFDALPIGLIVIFIDFPIPYALCMVYLPTFG